MRSGWELNRPCRHRHPGPILLTEELVYRYTGGFTHQVVHRRTQAEGGLVADPVKGVGADVAVQHLLFFDPLRLAQAGQTAVGADDVDRALGQVVVVNELVGLGFVVLQRYPVDVDIGDLQSAVDLIGVMSALRRDLLRLQRI